MSRAYALQPMDNHCPHSHISLYRQLLRHAMLLDDWKKTTKTLRNTLSLNDSRVCYTAFSREARTVEGSRIRLNTAVLLDYSSFQSMSLCSNVSIHAFIRLLSGRQMLIVPILGHASTILNEALSCCRDSQLMVERARLQRDTAWAGRATLIGRMDVNSKGQSVMVELQNVGR